MSHELIHASVPRGLRGDVGFCIVSMTRGLPEEIVPALEGLSAYDMNEELALGADQTEWAYRVLSLQGSLVPVLSRIVPCAQEWRGRSNRVAHHIVLDAASLAPAGPAWMMFEHRHFASVPPPVEERSEAPALPIGSLAPRPALEWRGQGLDAGWAGVVAQTIADAGTATVYLAFHERMSVLPLLVDVFSLLPEARRWATTFSTRFGSTVVGARCQVRCVLADRAERAGLFREPGARILHILRGEAPPPSTAVDAGREGRFVATAKVEFSAAPSAGQPPPISSHPAQRPQRAERGARFREEEDEESLGEEDLVIRDGVRLPQPRVPRQAASGAPNNVPSGERPSPSPSARPAANPNPVAPNAPAPDAGSGWGADAARTRPGAPPTSSSLLNVQSLEEAGLGDVGSQASRLGRSSASGPLPLPAVLFVLAAAILVLTVIVGLIKFL